MSKRAIKSTKNHQKRNNINNVRIIMVCEATVTPTPTLPPTIYHSRHSFQYKQILIIIVIIAVISRMKSNINTIMIIMSTMVLRHTYILIILDRIIIITVIILIILLFVGDNKGSNCCISQSKCKMLWQYLWSTNTTYTGVFWDLHLIFSDLVIKATLFKRPGQLIHWKRW